MMKGEVDPPLLPDAEYPSWLWKLTEPQPMLSQLRRLDTQDQTLEQVSQPCARRMLFACFSQGVPAARHPKTSACDTFRTYAHRGVPATGHLRD